MGSLASAQQAASELDGLDVLNGYWLVKPLHAEVTDERQGDVLGKTAKTIIIIIIIIIIILILLL